MNFGQAFDKLINRRAYAIRLGKWNEDEFVRIQYLNSSNKKTTYPYIYKRTKLKTIAWVPTAFELCSDQWETLEKEIFPRCYCYQCQKKHY